MKLTKKKCIPCEDKSIKPLSRTQLKPYLPLVPKWILSKNGKHIVRTWLFADFVEAMKFAGQVAKIAEKEGHHPDFAISYNKLTLDLSTHSIKGLTENDFIVAAKIDAIA